MYFRFLTINFIIFLLCACGDKSSSNTEGSSLPTPEKLGSIPNPAPTLTDETVRAPELLIEQVQKGLLNNINQNHSFELTISEGFSAAIKDGITQGKSFTLNVSNVSEAAHSFFIFLTKNISITPRPFSSSENILYPSQTYEQFVRNLNDGIPLKSKSALYEQLDKLDPLIEKAMRDFLASKGVDTYELTVLEQIEVINNALTIAGLSSVGLDNIDHLSTRFLRDIQRNALTTSTLYTASHNHQFAGIISPYSILGIFKNSASPRGDEQLSILTINYNNWFLEGRFRNLFLESSPARQNLKLGYDFDEITFSINHYILQNLPQLTSASVEYSHTFSNITNVEMKLIIAGNLGYKKNYWKTERLLYQDISTTFSINNSRGVTVTSSLSWTPILFLCSFSLSLEK